MPFLVGCLRAVRPGTGNGDMILNVHFAETFLDYAGWRFRTTCMAARSVHYAKATPLGRRPAHVTD